MADSRKAGAYGTTGGDTSFRKTWDRGEYAAKAAQHDAKIKDESKARYEAKLAGKKYHARPNTPPDARDTEARMARMDFKDLVGKTSLVPAGASVGKRGKGAGFYCEDCDLTFKDNLQWVDHLNSKQHLVATGQTGEVRRAGVWEVRERLMYLKRKLEDEKSEEVVNLDSRLDRVRDAEEAEREKKRRRRNERRRKNKGDEDHIKKEYDDEEDDGIIR